MEHRNNILNELREISPVVADIGHQFPYSVPAGYFEGLADRLLSLVKADEANTPVLPKADHPYQAPQGYFEGLADTILQRVKADEANTSSLPKADHPYQAPQGYFEGLADTILQRVKADEANTPVLPKSINPYQVPQGYFEGLADTILQRVKADEANTPVLPKSINPYQVPQGYFEGLADTILQRIKATATDNASDELEIISPLLSQLDRKMPFSTPAGYFDELGENAIAGAQAIDFVNGALENLSPLMSGIRRMYVYEVPAGYFEQLPGKVLKAVKAQQPAKVVSMSFTRRVIRYAAAAVVAGLIITAGWLYTGNRGISDPTGLPPKDVAKLDSISDELLEKYLENQTPTPAETAIAATATLDEIDANDMKDMLADVTDEDLQQYIEKYSTIKDIQTN